MTESRGKTERRIRWAAALQQVLTEIESIQARLTELTADIRRDADWTGPGHYGAQKRKLLAGAVIRPPTEQTRARRTLTDEQVRTIRREYASGTSQRKLADIYGISNTTISSICKRYLYKDVK